MDDEKDDKFEGLFAGKTSAVLNIYREDADDPRRETAAVRVEGEVKEKLIAAKQSWAEEGRRLTAEPASTPDARRLPPGQDLTGDWPVLDLGLKPLIPADQWELTTAGLIERPVRWSWEQFIAQPQTRLKTDIHCVTAWSRYDNTWEGVSAKHLLKLVQPRAEVKHVIFHSHDGYTTNVRLDQFNDDDVLLAHTWQGEPIARDHGGPVRVVIPKLYFWKSAKWLKHITFLEHDAPGYWEARGYHNNGDPWKQQRYR